MPSIRALASRARAVPDVRRGLCRHLGFAPDRRQRALGQPRSGPRPAEGLKLFVGQREEPIPVVLELRPLAHLDHEGDHQGVVCERGSSSRGRRVTGGCGSRAPAPSHAPARRLAEAHARQRLPAMPRPSASAPSPTVSVHGQRLRLWAVAIWQCPAAIALPLQWFDERTSDSSASAPWSACLKRSMRRARIAPRRRGCERALGRPRRTRPGLALDDRLVSDKGRAVRDGGEGGRRSGGPLTRGHYSPLFLPSE